MVITTEIEKKKEKWKINHIKFTLRYRLERRMTQRKFVFMKFEDSLFLHFSEFFGEGAPVQVQVVGEALAVEGDRKGVGAGFGRLRGEVDQHALADRLWCSAENAVGEGKIFLHGDAEHVTAKLGLPWIITIGGLVEVSKIEKENRRGFGCCDIHHHRLPTEGIRLGKYLAGGDLA